MSKRSNSEQQKSNTQVEERDQKESTGALTTINFAADAGMGMENTSQDSFAIPFLGVLQSNSPQCTQGEAKYMPDARPGMLINTVTNKLFDGSKGTLFIPCAYRRMFLEWGPRQGEGAGFRGEHTAEAIAALRADKKIVEFEGRLYTPLADGSVNAKRCVRYADTRMHYGLLVDEDTAEFMGSLLSLTSTQIKKSKQIMSALTSVRVSTPNGRIQPPTFANKVRIQTVPESNDQGNWFGVKLSIEGQISDPALYAAAKAFHDLVTKGNVTANYDATGDGEPSGDGAPREGF